MKNLLLVPFLVLSIAASPVLAYGPTQAFPNNNLPAPLDTGTVTQQRTGNIQMTSAGAVDFSTFGNAGPVITLKASQYINSGVGAAQLFLQNTIGDTRSVFLNTGNSIVLSGKGISLEVGSSSGAGVIKWGATGFLQADQGGSIELGGSNSIANPQTGATPYIDFHYGTGSTQDYNVRIINDADGRLTANATTFAVTGNLTTVGLKMTGGTPGAGKVLTSDANGNGSWATLSTPSLTWSNISGFPSGCPAGS